MPDTELRIGASWYPEMWPEDQWEIDARKMRQLGFNMTRLFEFAWHRLEPEEGKFELHWAKRVLDICHRHGIAVMVGTPTAAPPAWLTQKYPETLQVYHDGRVASHGHRKHYSVYSQKYREFCAQIVEEMTKAFAGHPALHSWQIDNEMGGDDHGERARAGLQEWLRQRYGNIEQLNRLWGLEFWSQAYSNFSQIPLPREIPYGGEVRDRHHPSLLVAYARYNSDAWTSFIALQCEIIRRYSDRPITTNMTGGIGMHWFQHNKALDRVGHSLYKDVAHYHLNVQYFERMRAEKPAPYWFIETAPSWSAGGKMWNIHHDEKGIAAISWLSVLLGGSMVLYWQWREHWAGQEMLHGTLVTATGKWRPNRDAIAKLAEEFAEHGEWILSHPPKPPEMAIVQAPESAWSFSIEPLDENMDYAVRWRDDYYLPLVQHHIWRDVIDPTHDLTPYRILIVPLMPMMSTDMRRRLRAWVEAGGLLLLGPIVGHRSDEFTAFTDREFGGLEELMGGESSIRFTVHWVEDRTTVDFAAEPAEGLPWAPATKTRNWCEGFAPTTGQAIAHYRGGYGNGHASALFNGLDKGAVITLGFQPSPETYLAMVRWMMSRAGVEPVAKGSPSIIVVPRASADGKPGGYGLVNISEQPQTVTLPSAGFDLLTGRSRGPELSLSPMEVAVLRIS